MHSCKDVKIHCVIGSFLLVVAVGLTWLFEDKELPAPGPVRELSGVVSSAYQDFKPDRSIVTYEAKVMGDRGYLTSRRFFGFQNACAAAKLNKGEKVLLQIETLGGKPLVRRVTNLHGCRIFDDEMRLYMRQKSQLWGDFLLLTMYGLSCASFCAAAFMGWRIRRCGA